MNGTVTKRHFWAILKTFGIRESIKGFVQSKPNRAGHSDGIVQKVMICAIGLSREIFKRLGICALPMIDDVESREGGSPIRLTFRRHEGEQIAGTLMNKGKTGSERLNGPAQRETSILLTGT